MNASSPLLIGTPDGSGQGVHPDVIFIPAGFLGYRYWMALTPFPFGDPRVENPCIRVSHDGLVWSRFAGMPDPVIDAPVDLTVHHADADLACDGQRIYLYFMTRERRTEINTFYVTSTEDGRNWGQPQEIMREKWIVSPAVVQFGHQWFLWHVRFDVSCGAHKDNQSKIIRLSGATPTAFYGAEECSIEIPGHVPWHIDVIQSENRAEALIAAFPFGAQPSRCRLFHATSHDGKVFRMSDRKPIISPSCFGWDNRMIYRSTFLANPSEKGNYKIWYSGASWAMRCGIAQVTGSMHNLREARSESAIPVSIVQKIREDVRGATIYLLQQYMPQFLYALIRAILGRNPLQSKQNT